MFRKTYLIAGLVVATGLAAAPAMAREHCTVAPGSQWKPIHEITTDAGQLGYKITGVEREGTCYEVKGYDHHGAKIKILYNPETGKPMAHH